VTAQAVLLDARQQEMVHFHAGRIIPIDVDIAIRAGALLSIARAA
jgi:hypothetical protein